VLFFAALALKKKLPIIVRNLILGRRGINIKLINLFFFPQEELKAALVNEFSDIFKMASIW